MRARERVEHALEAVEDHHIDRVAGELHYEAVKLIYRVRERVGVVGICRLHKLNESRRGRGVRSPAGQTRALALDKYAHLHQIAHERLVHVVRAVVHYHGKGLRRRLAAVVGHKGALTGDDPQKAPALKLQHTLIHRAAAHAQRDRELALGGQPVPGTQGSGEYATLHHALKGLFLRGRVSAHGLVLLPAE